MGITLSPGTIPSILNYELGQQGLRDRRRAADEDRAFDQQRWSDQAPLRSAEAQRVKAAGELLAQQASTVKLTTEEAMRAAADKRSMDNMAKLLDSLEEDFGGNPEALLGSKAGAAAVRQAAKDDPFIAQSMNVDAASPQDLWEAISVRGDNLYKLASQVAGAGRRSNNAIANTAGLASAAGATELGMDPRQAVADRGLAPAGGRDVPGGFGGVTDDGRTLRASQKLGFDNETALDLASGNPTTEAGRTNFEQSLAGLQVAATPTQRLATDRNTAQRDAEVAAAGRSAELTGLTHAAEMAAARQQSEEAKNARLDSTVQRMTAEAANRTQTYEGLPGTFFDQDFESLGYNIDPEAPRKLQIEQFSAAIAHDVIDTANRAPDQMAARLAEAGVKLGESADPADPSTWSRQALRVAQEAVLAKRREDIIRQVGPDSNSRGTVPEAKYFKDAASGKGVDSKKEARFARDVKSGLTAAGEGVSRVFTGPTATSVARSVGRTADRSINQLGEYGDELLRRVGLRPSEK